MRLEPIVVTIGAPVLSDTLSLIVFAVCVSTYTTGFSPEGLAIQLIEIAVFVPLILIGLSRAGAWALSRMGSDEGGPFPADARRHGGGGCARRPDKSAGDCRCVPGRIGGQRRGSGESSKGQAGLFWESPIHPQLLYRHRPVDRSGRLCRKHRRTLSSGHWDHCCSPRGKVDRRGGRGPRLPLLARSKIDGMGADPAAGGRDPRPHLLLTIRSTGPGSGCWTAPCSMRCSC